MPSLTREIKYQSDRERDILRRIEQRVRYWSRITSSKRNAWAKAEEKTLAYLPESETDAKRRRARENGLPQYTVIQIPYSYAAVMAAHTYITSVFFGRAPVFQYSGRHGESQQKVQAMEALVDYQMLNGMMGPPMYTWTYDALKYGFGVQCLYWCEDWETITEIAEQEEIDPIMQTPTGRMTKMQSSIQVRNYAGNKVFNVQPQDFIWDARYPAREFQRGEFCGRRFKMGWNEVVRRTKQGYYMNIEHVGKSRSNDYYSGDQGSEQLERPEVFSSFRDNEPDDLADVGQAEKKRHPMMIGAYEIVIEVIPGEWGLGSSDWPEKWVFTCLDDFSVLIGVQPLGAFHCKYPYSVIPLEPEGYGLTTRGLPDVLEPVQNTIDWLINSHFFNVRAALNNKFIVDPSRVIMKDVLDPLPGGIVRMKPIAYGTDPKGTMHQMQVVDITRTHLQDFQTMVGIGERIGGVNDQIMGMLDTGGRKTATEVRTSTSFGINRLKTIAEYASLCGVDPLSRMIVQNTQQYYDMELKFKIAGDLLNNAGQSFVDVNPELISGFYDFVPVDGTLPIDRMAQVSLWKDLLTSIISVPAIGMQYDVAGIFQWVAQLAGLKNITQFKVQVMPDQVLQAWGQQGNSVPMTPGGPRGRPGGSANQLGHQQSMAAMLKPAMAA